MDAIINKVNELNKKAGKIDPILFLFDEFCPKTMPFNADSEVRFWYLIINLYGLFYDSGRYILFSKLSQTNNYEVRNFYQALNEVRSIFCHNKTPESYLGYRIANRKLDYLVSDWSKKTNFCTRKWSSGTSVQWDNLYDLFYNGAVNALDIIEVNMASVKPFDWFAEIANWYFSNDEVIVRAMTTYTRINGKNIPQLKKYNLACYLALMAGREKNLIKKQISKLIVRNIDDLKSSLPQKNAYKYLFQKLKDDSVTVTPLNLLLPFLDHVYLGTALDTMLQIPENT